MKVVRWGEWDDLRWRDVAEMDEKEREEADRAVIESLRETGYHFDGEYHQNGLYGVPVFDNGKYYEISMRSWGGIMARAFPEEFDDPDDQMNYVRWYLGRWCSSDEDYSNWKVPAYEAYLANMNAKKNQ